MKITNKEKVIIMRNGVEIWLEEKRADELIRLLEITETKFVKINGEMINSADITGVFEPMSVEDMKRRKNGQWKCEFGKWHEKNTKCGHGELRKYKTVS